MEQRIETSVETLEGNRVRLTITVPSAEVDRHIAAAYVELGGKIRVPGFRKGKVPRQMVDTYAGPEAALAEAVSDVVNEAYSVAIQAEGLRPIDRPDTGELAVLVEGADYTFTTEVDIRPELELSSLDALVVKVPPKETTDREIDAQIDYLRDRFATLEPVEGRGAEGTDFVLLSFVGSIEGEPYEGNTVDRYLYEMGAGQMPPAFDEAILGAVPGDERTATFEIPEADGNADYAGKTATFAITVHEIKEKRRPEADDQFAANVGGFDSIGDLREDIRTKLDENKALAHDRLVERGAREALSGRLVGEVPDVMVRSRAATMTERFFETLDERGYTLEDYSAATGVPVADVRSDIAREAAALVREELALEALFRREGLEVSDADLDEELARMAAPEGGDPGELRDRLEDAGLIPMVREELTGQVALRWLLEHVEIVEGIPGDADAEEGAAKPKRGARKAAAKEAKE